ncbi:YjbH domain-containing protein (plasmid) [Pseudohalocynthiibacter aestuariivivens]|uniref:YjbH domain-containing protein n=1 Tax=Roseovarius pelagicus TaxID=2980108 RepID=A0ABY6D8K5_9RHOB|nr:MULTISPECIES: YjbH domain-containing protein [Rhodobacterales]QIE47925.1 YjbH domain-containing protein [Pseudohalocynthiibacter aestuariivivens]UXX81418.1 YjbH domain-containing protein [Roseovarius pelagicus]
MAAATALLVSAPVLGGADNLQTTQTNIYGTPGGLIDMPTAEVAPEGQLSTTLSAYGAGNNLTTRTTLSFQILPRLSASFRYSGVGGLLPEPGRPTFDTLYDRSFDLSYRLINEGRVRPALTIGLRDLAGTGVYSGEYLVATKSIADRFRLSAGVGWGRLGTYGTFSSTGNRPAVTLGKGGIPSYDRWFRGDMAAFGGLSWQVTQKLSFAAEYSSDGYQREVRANALERKIPWNFGVGYKVSDSLRLNAYSLYGSEFGAGLTLSLNTRKTAVKGGLEGAPLPVAPRAPGSAADLGWTTDQTRQAQAIGSLKGLLDRDGIKLHGLQIEPRSAHIQIRNTRFDMRAQAVGRTARAMSRSLPASVETFTITQMIEGQPTTSVTMSRTDLERLENAPATQILAASRFQDGAVTDNGVTLMPDAYPRFDYSIGPYLRFSVFDPENPLRYSAGIKAKAEYHIAPGWIAAGSVSQKIIGNLGDITLPGPSGLPRVRSNVAFYNQSDEPTIDYLTLAKYGRPAKNFYSRLTVGYLERMYAGASAELLWKPVDSRFALGVEVNYVLPRAYDQQFGTRTRATPTGVIPEWNGHVSAYYDVGYGFHTQLDVGQYLAGDFGATLSVDRVFANGWSVGAYATKTDVSSATFGEGSFDKGIRIVIPFSWGTGSPSLQKSETVLKSLSRDGGARLEVDGRLYDKVKDTHRPQMAKTWGKFWR